MTKNLNIFNPIKLRFGWPSYIVDVYKKRIACELPIEVLFRDPNCPVNDILTLPDSFCTVKSTAKCSDSDLFSEEKGKRIAYEKAKRSAYKRVCRDFKSIAQDYMMYVKMLNYAAEKYLTAAEKEDVIIDKIVAEN